MSCNIQRFNQYKFQPRTLCNFDYLAYSVDNTQDEAETEAKVQTSLLIPQCFGCYC